MLRLSGCAPLYSQLRDPRLPIVVTAALLVVEQHRQHVSPVGVPEAYGHRLLLAQGIAVAPALARAGRPDRCRPGRLADPQHGQPASAG